MQNGSTRDQFSSQWGFILACIGSAVGMGNIWLFPFRVGQFGGAAFLIPYILFVIVIGYTGVVEEMCFGRAMKTGPHGAFLKATHIRGSHAGAVIGWIPVIGSLGIAIGYTVVVGWIIRFMTGACTGSLLAAENSGAYFGAIAGPFASLPWHGIAVGGCFIIMAAGISSGIEKVNKVLMPAFFVLFIILAVRVATLPKSAEGYAFLFQTDWRKLADVKTWVYALGQAFFSLSLAGSGTIVYGSYLNDNEDAPASAKFTALFDTLAALLAALVIIPAVFVYNLEPSAGPPLMFITMPVIFKEMPAGVLFAVIFFTAVLFAGITSLINLYETPVELLQQKFKLSRKVSLAIVLGIGFAAGLIVEDGAVLGTWMDVISIYIIPIGALLAGIMFFWVCGEDFVLAAVSKGSRKLVPKSYALQGKYVYCGLTLIVYILGIFYGGIG